MLKDLILIRIYIYIYIGLKSKNFPWKSAYFAMKQIEYVLVSLCVSLSIWVGRGNLMVLLVMKRDIWMTSLNNFRNCKMRTVQILLLRLCLFSLMILRSSSTIWPELCEYCYLCGWFWKKFVYYPFFWMKGNISLIEKGFLFFYFIFLLRL